MRLGDSATVMYGAARTLVARAVSPSEAASLGGKKAKTPIIAGSICGGLMLLAWVIGFGIYFRKRYNRKQRNRLIAEGKAAPREKDLEVAKEKIIIPPDPAVLLGQRKPGEMAFPEREHSKDGHHHPPWSHHGSYTKSGQNSSPLPQTTSTPKQTQELEEKEDSITDEMSVPVHV